MSPCQPVRRHLSDVIDGEKLPPLLRAYVGLHRTLCIFCRRTEQSLRATKAASAALRDVVDDDPAPGRS